MQQTENIRSPLSAAYARLATAQIALERGRWEALFGTAYDADTYDALILEWRAARQEVAAAAGAGHSRPWLPEDLQSGAGITLPERSA